MIQRAPWAPACVAIALLVASASAGDPAPTPPPTMTLAWKWKKGDRFALDAEKKSHTKTVTKAPGVDEKEEEDEVSSTHATAEVEEVLEDGRARVVLSYREMEMTQTSGQKTISLHGLMTEDGKPHVVAEMKMPGAEMFQSEGEDLLKAVGANLLAMKIRVELSAAGDVLSTKAEGDLTAGVRRDTPVRRIMVATLERMLTMENLAQVAVGEAFPQLPPGPVAATARWPAKRVFSLSGLTMRGKGAAFVFKTEPNGVLGIAEEMVYDIDSKGFAKTMESVLAEAVPNATVKASLRADGSPVVRYSGRFDPAAGHCLEWSVPRLEMKLVGNIVVGVMDRKNTVTLRITVTGDSRCTWTKL